LIKNFTVVVRLPIREKKLKNKWISMHKLETASRCIFVAHPANFVKFDPVNNNCNCITCLPCAMKHFN